MLSLLAGIAAGIAAGWLMSTSENASKENHPQGIPKNKAYPNPSTSYSTYQNK